MSLSVVDGVVVAYPRTVMVGRVGWPDRREAQGMPIYMDRHELAGTTAEVVAQEHLNVAGTTERVREVPRPITASDVVIGTRRRLPRNRVIPGLESSDLWPHRSKPHEAPEAEALQRSRLPLPGARAGQVRPSRRRYARLKVDATECGAVSRAGCQRRRRTRVAAIGPTEGSF